MTSNARPGTRILGSLRSAAGAGVVRIEDRYDTDIDDLWAALTDPGRLARWWGQVEGDLRLGGEFRLSLESAGWDGTGRVEACEPPRRLRVTTRESDESWRKGRGTPPFDETIEATLTAEGDQTSLVIEVQGMPLDKIAFYGPGGRSTPRISPPTSPGVSAATARRGGTSSSLPIRTWRPTSASFALHPARMCSRLLAHP
jgi:uncharacterized protein YndB with AHSA1/START domain